MKYCIECGTKLVEKPLKNEGMIPYCTSCEAFRFPVFSTAVSMLVLSPDRTRVLMIQQYGKGNNVLVAGYVNKGENAESAVVREVREEIGLNVGSLCFTKSEYFPNTNTLMINFACVADSDSLDGVDREEVDRAEWFTLEEAREKIKPDSLAKKFLINYLDNIMGK